MWRTSSLCRAVVGMFLVLVSYPAAGLSERSVSIEMSGISTMVFDDLGLHVLYPNLADLSWLPARFSFHPGDIGYHQLRIFFNERPKSVPQGLRITEGFPCQGEKSRWLMINATEDLPGMEFELQLPADKVTRLPTNPKLPDLFDVLFKANWPLPHRKIDPDLMQERMSFEDVPRLAGRLFIPGVARDHLEARYFPTSYRLNGKVVEMPRVISLKRWSDGPVTLCFRELSADGPDRCVEWGADGKNLRLLFEHQPPHVRGLGCRGGRRDFVAHYSMLEGLGWFPALPLPMEDTGKKGEPAFADDAMCSPAEGRYP